VAGDEADDPDGQGDEADKTDQDEEVDPLGTAFVLSRVGSDFSQSGPIGSFFGNLRQDFFGLRDFVLGEGDVLQIPLEFLELRSRSKGGVGEDDVILEPE